MRVLVTGARGSIGSRLAPFLEQQGCEVTGLDTGFFAECLRPGQPAGHTPLVRKDTREVLAADLQGFDAIVYLAELSNDPLGELSPALTEEINVGGTLRLARMAKRAGVGRFVYFSSCSVYGAVAGKVCNEGTTPNPLTAYSRAKVICETGLLGLRSENFHPVVLRLATVYGASPGLRLDLVLNNLAASAFLWRRVQVDSDGIPWRPLIHVEDASTAVMLPLDAPTALISGEIFNCGDTHANYQIRQLADGVRQTFPGSQVEFGSRAHDRRSYRVGFGKIHRRLGFSPRHDVWDGAPELGACCSQIGLQELDMRATRYFRLRQVQTLIGSGQLATDLRWAEGAFGRHSLQAPPNCSP